MTTDKNGISEPYQIVEKKYAKFVHAKYGVSCNSGTSALHLALLALGVTVGDQVIIPDFTMAAVAFAVSYCGATPVFADVSLETYGILPSEIRRLKTNKTKAIIAVHTYGRLCDMKGVLEAAGDIPVIEDACEAQGAVKKSKAAMTCWSFYRNKIIAGEEGGVVTTNNDIYDARCRYYKNMCFGEEHDYFHIKVGYNYRMPNAQAKLVLQSLAKFKYNFRRRQHIERWYRENLPDWIGTKKRDAVWFYEVQLPKKFVYLIKGARHSFRQLSSFPFYYTGPQNTNAEDLSKCLILLPANPELTKKEIIKICNFIKKGS